MSVLQTMTDNCSFCHLHFPFLFLPQGLLKPNLASDVVGVVMREVARSHDRCVHRQGWHKAAKLACDSQPRKLSAQKFKFEHLCSAYNASYFHKLILEAVTYTSNYGVVFCSLSQTARWEPHQCIHYPPIITCIIMTVVLLCGVGFVIFLGWILGGLRLPWLSIPPSLAIQVIT